MMTSALGAKLLVACEFRDGRFWRRSISGFFRKPFDAQALLAAVGDALCSREVEDDQAYVRALRLQPQP